LNLDVDQKVALSKQRKFSLLMSLAVIGCYVFGVTISRDATYSGFAIKLAHPEYVRAALWIVWTWALLRYAQRLYELFGLIRGDIIEDVDAEDWRIALRFAQRRAETLAKNGELGEGKPNVRIQGRVYLEPTMKQFIQERQKLPQKEEPAFYPSRTGGRVYRQFGGAFTWSDDKGGGGTSSFNFEVEWTRWQTIRFRAYSWFHAALRLPAITEHVAPLLLALVALAAPLLFGAHVHSDSLIGTIGEHH
jgi:hypothetical protein